MRIRREDYLLKGTMVDQDLMKGEDSQNIPVIKQVFPINMRGKFWMNMAKVAVLMITVALIMSDILKVDRREAVLSKERLNQGEGTMEKGGTMKADKTEAEDLAKGKEEVDLENKKIRVLGIGRRNLEMGRNER